MATEHTQYENRLKISVENCKLGKSLTEEMEFALQGSEYKNQSNKLTKFEIHKYKKM